MNKQKLFFSEKEKVHFFVTDGDIPLCESCQEEIENNLVYQTVWRKRSVYKRFFHVRCFESISSRGDMDEFKVCAVVSEIPDNALPIFERKPSLAGAKEASCFEVSKILKGSDAQVLDLTRVTKDPNQSMMPHFERNLLEHQKREEELGDGIFIANDRKRDVEKQREEERRVEEKNESMEKAAKNIVSGKKPSEEKEEVSRKRTYENQNQPEVNIEEYLKIMQNSQILLPEQDNIELLEQNNQKLLEEK